MIFLSYSHKDKAIVSHMAEAFRKTFGEDKVFFDQWSIQPGDSLVDRMGEGLANCCYFFFLVRTLDKIKFNFILSSVLLCPAWVITSR